MKLLLTKDEQVWLWTLLKTMEESAYAINPDEFEKMRITVMDKVRDAK